MKNPWSYQKENDLEPWNVYEKSLALPKWEWLEPWNVYKKSLALP